MEVSGENHILDHSVNFFLSSTLDKLLLGSGFYQSCLQGIYCWNCINVDYKPVGKVHFIAFLHDIEQQYLTRDFCYTNQYNMQFHI